MKFCYALYRRLWRPLLAQSCFSFSRKEPRRRMDVIRIMPNTEYRRAGESARHFSRSASRKGFLPSCWGADLLGGLALKAVRIPPLCNNPTTAHAVCPRRHQPHDRRHHHFGLEHSGSVANLRLGNHSRVGWATGRQRVHRDAGADKISRPDDHCGFKCRLRRPVGRAGLAFLNRKFVEPFRDKVRDLPSAPGSRC